MSTDLLDPVEWYREYRQSQDWLQTERKTRRRAGWRCRRCKQPAKGLTVIHLNYERIGLERLTDLTAYCQTCLEGAHAVLPRPEDHPAEIDTARHSLARALAKGTGKTRWDAERKERVIETPQHVHLLKEAAERRAQERMKTHVQTERQHTVGWAMANWETIPLPIRLRMAKDYREIARRLRHDGTLGEPMNPPGNPANETRFRGTKSR